MEIGKRVYISTTELRKLEDEVYQAGFDPEICLVLYAMTGDDRPKVCLSSGEKALKNVDDSFELIEQVIAFSNDDGISCLAAVAKRIGE